VFHRWLIGDMGTPGEYMYQPIHLYSTAGVLAIFLALVVIALRFRKAPDKSRKLLLGISIFQLIFEIGWRLIYLFVKGDSLVNW